MRKPRQPNGITEFPVEPRAGVAVAPSQEPEEFEPDYTTLAPAEKKKEAHRLFVTSKNSLQELSELFAIPERTLQDWALKEEWREEKNKIEIMSSKLKESLKFLLDPQTEEQAIAEGNLKVLLEIQGIHLAHMKYAMLTGDHNLSTILPSGLADSIQKYANALEKLNKTSTNIKNGGVSKSEVTHKHEIDMDKALQLAMQLKKETGKVITVTEAAKILDDQMKGVSTEVKDAEVVPNPKEVEKNPIKVSEPNVPKKGAAQKLATKLKDLGNQPPPQELVDKINTPSGAIQAEKAESVPEQVQRPKLNLSRFNIAKKK